MVASLAAWNFAVGAFHVHDDPPLIQVHWERWLGWLRTRRLAGAAASSDSIDLLRAARGLERLQRDRWGRAYASQESSFARSPGDVP